MVITFPLIICCISLILDIMLKLSKVQPIYVRLYQIEIHRSLEVDYSIYLI